MTFRSLNLTDWRADGGSVGEPPLPGVIGGFLRHSEIVAARMAANEGCERDSIDSRQQRRAYSRIMAFESVCEYWSEELRAMRRYLAIKWLAKYGDFRP